MAPFSLRYKAQAMKRSLSLVICAIYLATEPCVSQVSCVGYKCLVFSGLNDDTLQLNLNGYWQSDPNTCQNTVYHYTSTDHPGIHLCHHPSKQNWIFTDTFCETTVGDMLARCDKARHNIGYCGSSDWKIQNGAGGEYTAPNSVTFVTLVGDCPNQPSHAPTIASISPTNTPTVTSLAPTNAPSNAPSSSTISPTSSPSLAPTKAPSDSPTFVSLAPTNAPSQSPSQQPSNTPSISPTNAPSLPPTAAPSKVPTFITLDPTNAPSLSPTKAPSNAPSLSPTISPTFVSFTPTNAPSLSPSASPSNAPSLSPTAAPSDTPTFTTWNPTNAPSNAPTVTTISPTSSPSLSPTTTPSNSPTFVSLIPTNAPSLPPTAAPSKAPTFITLDPTNAPSLSPIKAPSNAPSFSPSSSPLTEITCGGWKCLTFSGFISDDYGINLDGDWEPYKYECYHGAYYYTSVDHPGIYLCFSVVNRWIFSYESCASESYDVWCYANGWFDLQYDCTTYQKWNIGNYPYQHFAAPINIDEQTNDCPTSSPTRAPSNIPTIASIAPTNAPSITSLAPTNDPSNAPSSSTISPTSSPSLPPTKAPSNSPTFASLTPTNAPTQSPTQQPSNTPSISPTNAPLLPPTAAPSNTPTFSTLDPTNTPSIAPTAHPSNVPSNSPTELPSNAPSLSPSSSPSLYPTYVPSLTPTEAPSNAPSSAPTNVPSLTPSNAPTILTSAPTATDIINGAGLFEMFIVYNTITSVSDRYSLVLFTRSEHYMSLEIDALSDYPHGINTVHSIEKLVEFEHCTADDEHCVQFWMITYSVECPLAVNGNWSVQFTTKCEKELGESQCLGYLTKHSIIHDTISLKSDQLFIDELCIAALYSHVFVPNFKYYTEDDIIYIKISIEDDDEYLVYNIFVHKVFTCTVNDTDSIQKKQYDYSITPCLISQTLHILDYESDEDGALSFKIPDALKEDIYIEIEATLAIATIDEANVLKDIARVSYQMRDFRTNIVMTNDAVNTAINGTMIIVIVCIVVGVLCIFAIGFGLYYKQKKLKYEIESNLQPGAVLAASAASASDEDESTPELQPGASVAPQSNVNSNHLEVHDSTKVTKQTTTAGEPDFAAGIPGDV